MDNWELMTSITNSTAFAAPIPRLEPVTIATFPSNMILRTPTTWEQFNVGCLSLNRFKDRPAFSFCRILTGRVPPGPTGFRTDSAAVWPEGRNYQTWWIQIELMAHLLVAHRTWQVSTLPSLWKNPKVGNMYNFLWR